MALQASGEVAVRASVAGVARVVSDRIAVMYLGRIVEVGPAQAVGSDPQMPYTQALLSAVPVPDPRRNATRERLVLEGDVPSPIDPPSGCRFHTRCPWSTEVCQTDEPQLVDHTGGREPGHVAACHHPRNLD